MSGPSAGRPGIGANLLLVAVAVAVTLLVLELAVRLYAYQVGRGFAENPYAFISPFFTSDGWPPPRREDGMLVFKEGERVLPRKEPGEIRVVCLGGSTTLPARDAERVSYPRALERRLAAAFPGATIRVLNAGENSYSTAHSLVNLGLRVLEAEPDIVTVYHAVNDLSVNYFGSGAVSDYANKYLTPYYLGYRHRAGAWAALTHVSRLARILENRLDVLRLEAESRDETRDYRPGLPLFARNLRSIVALARTHGVEPVLGTEAARAALRGEEGFAAYNDAVRRVATDTGAPLADVAASIEDDGLFVDDVHYTSAGADRVADVWLRTVAPLVRARIGAR
jgi:lysophospholipase L1-like esterase